MPKGRILILEDDARVANAYAEALREDGNDVTVCTGFEEARDYVKTGMSRRPPDGHPRGPI